MATSRPNTGLGDVRALFQVGSFVGLSDAELLERYFTGPGGIAEVAFAALVQRHGPTVLRVCTDVLNDPHDAQDAAQVTFLVLARRAGSIRRRNALASWLFGVGRRVAVQAKVEAARRRVHERRRAEMATREHERRSRAPVTGETWAELFEEIDRLSERDRSAIVLCDLEGLTHEQAAQRLGCPTKTVQGRVYRARELLRQRLTRRGITATAGMLGVSLAQRTASAAPSDAWVQETAQAAVQLAAGQAVERLLSVEAAALLRHVLRAMTMTRLRITALGGVLLAASAVGMVVAWGRMDHSEAVDRPPPADVPPVAAAMPPGRAEPPDDAPDLARIRNNLNQIGLGMHNYRGAHGRFAAPAIQGADGKPLLSWRVAILPYIGESELYNEFKLDEPWDSPHNKPLLERMPSLYASAPRPPGQPQRNLTHFQVFVGEGTPFEGGSGPRWEDFPDGPDRTILTVEADEAVPWTKPDDLPYATDKPLPSLGKGPRGNFLVLMANGSSRFIPAKFDEVLLRRAITRDDKQPLDPNRLGSFDPPPTPSKAKPGRDNNQSTTSPPGRRGADQTGTPRSGDRITLSGRVLDPDAKPVEGAGVYFIRPVPFVWVPHPRPPRALEPKATSGPDGRFKILIDRAEWDDVCSIPNRFGPQLRTFPAIAAVASRYGPSWVLLPRPEAQSGVTLRLVKDDVPIEGRILDLEGRPVPGASVTIEEIWATPGEDLTPVIKALNSGTVPDVPSKMLAASAVGPPPTTMTDGEGRFRLAGIGRERAVSLGISGPTIQSGGIRVMTRLEFQASPARFERPKLPLADSASMSKGPMVYPARFEHAVGPTKPIEGVVRDRASGRPLPGAMITTVAVFEREGRPEGWGNSGGGIATADAQGRFRIVGAPKSRDLGVHVFPPKGQPYLERMEHVGDTPGLAPIVHDVGLTRGVPVRGRLIDQVTRRPVRGVVHYFLLDINPSYGVLRYSLGLCRVPTDDDGSFSIVALAGPGLLAAAAHSDKFTKGVGVDRIKLAKLQHNTYFASPLNADPTEFDTLLELDLPADSGGVERTIELIPSK
jgi:RNA polymerase sigma factor (sigma-70 family)